MSTNGNIGFHEFFHLKTTNKTFFFMFKAYHSLTLILEGDGKRQYNKSFHNVWYFYALHDSVFFFVYDFFSKEDKYNIKLPFFTILMLAFYYTRCFNVTLFRLMVCNYPIYLTFYLLSQQYTAALQHAFIFLSTTIYVVNNFQLTCQGFCILHEKYFLKRCELISS